MSIFDRLKRLARSEISEMKRVLSERDDLPGDPLAGHARDETERQRLIREAEEELARAEHDILAAEIDAGAALWGNAGAPFPGTYPNATTATTAPTPGTTGTDIERGAALWGAPEPEVVKAPNAAPRPPDAIASTATPPYESRTHAFPREVRDAYAALELPLGSDRPAVEHAFRELLHRYHPDKHVGDPRREAMANDLTIRIREARDVLTAWLERPAP